MLIKEIVIGLITILESRQIQVREDTVVYEDGVELSRTYMRYVMEPGDDVATPHAILKDLANLLWTPEVVATRKEFNRRVRESIANNTRGTVPAFGGETSNPIQVRGTDKGASDSRGRDGESDNGPESGE